MATPATVKHPYQQAHRRTRVDPMHVLGWCLFVAGAAVVAGAVYFALVLVTSMAQYIPSSLR